MGSTSEHFSASELACHHCGVNNCTPELVDALERFRAAVGNKPVQVHDAYRCVIHNAMVSGSAKDSQHTLGNAADVSVPGMTAAQLEAVARTVPEIHGIGRNDKANWVHIDVRPAVVLALWCYDDRGWCKYYPPATAEVPA